MSDIEGIARKAMKIAKKKTEPLLIALKEE